MNESGIDFLRVRIDILRDHGSDAACVYALLCLVARKRPRDERGYFLLDSSFATRTLGFDRFRLARARNRLAEAGLVDYIEGRNQNCKPRYKLL